MLGLHTGPPTNAKSNAVGTNKATRFAEGGEYLPLSVWATRGFDTEAVRTKSRPSDKMEDEVLGTVYRVRIISKVAVMQRTIERESKRQRQGPVDPAKASPALLVLEDGNVSSTDSSSSTSSSSSSSGKKKSKEKKPKKNKRNNEEKELSAAERRALEKASKMQVKVAEGVIAKIAPAVAALDALTAKDNFAVIAPSIKERSDGNHGWEIHR